MTGRGGSHAYSPDAVGTLLWLGLPTLPPRRPNGLRCFVNRYFGGLAVTLWRGGSSVTTGVALPHLSS